ncbi:MAG: hypothetical protein Q7W54_05810 [Bacteroidota bacterium]|nr:hypothetical protein [Bacteroidota bacterium]
MEKVTLGIHFVLRMNKITNGIAPIYARITVRCISLAQQRGTAFPKISHLVVFSQHCR